jgi:Polyketide cyclase / dehydrase and lipid transport
MKTTTWVFALTFALIITGGVAYAEQTPMSVALERKGFEQIAHRKGVKVFKHKYDNNIRLGADATINAPVAEVLKAVMNYEGQVGKIARLSESRVLRRGKGWLTVYQRLNLPVISDRDFTLKVRWGKRGDTTWVSYKALRRGPPERSGVVRVSYHEGSWQLRPIRGGQATRARFQVSIDMSGWLPSWLARSGSGKEVPELFTAIRKMVSTQSLRSAKCTTNCS